jgi:hypothetical protein
MSLHESVEALLDFQWLKKGDNLSELRLLIENILKFEKMAKLQPYK